MARGERIERSKAGSRSSSARRPRSSCRAARWRSRSRSGSGATADGSRTVAFHPTCHLELHEERAYAHLHGLRARLVGDPNRLIRLEDLEAIREPIAALLLELPQREIGGLLPEWDDLVAQVGLGARARDRRASWTARACGRRCRTTGDPHAEVAGLFDSVYVSFYKGLGAMAGRRARGGCRADGRGARLAAPAGWQPRDHAPVRRLRRDPRSTSASTERRRATSRMRARSQRRSPTLEGLEVVPNPPQTAMFHVLLRGERRTALRGRARRWRRSGRSSCSETRARRRRRAGSSIEVMVGRGDARHRARGAARPLRRDPRPRGRPDQPANTSRSPYSTISAHDGGDSSIPIIRSAAGSPLAR